MSDEPVAKRTRLSVSRSQNEDLRVAEEVQKGLKVLYEQYNTMMSICEEVVQTVPKMKQTVKTMKNLVTKEVTHYQLSEMNTLLKVVEGFITSAQSRLDNIKQYVDYISIEKLHDDECIETDLCILGMQKVLARDPLSLERKRECFLDPFDNRHKRSPLHDAVRYGHVECVEFLLEKGADVTSLTTYDEDTILHTLYEMDLDTERFDMLKLLLNHGVSCMFSHKQAGEFAIRTATMQLAIDEVSLLLQHGITLTSLTVPEIQDVLIRSWENYDLPMLKLVFLHYPNQLYLRLRYVGQYLALVSYKKMILKGVPLDLCLDKYLEALKFYKAFGGKFRVNPSRDPKRDLLQFFKCYKHRRHFKGAKKRIEALVSNPMSLKEISRLAVRKYIPKDYVENIKKLEVPVDLQPFLRFDDVTITNLPEGFNNSSVTDSSSDGEEGDDNE